MGPQLYRCGNGLYSEKADVTLKSLQWGRNFIVAEIWQRWTNSRASSTCFNGAATLSLRKCGRGCDGHHRHQGFNGAATLSLRKCPYQVVDRSPLIHASMGPQLYRCGNVCSGCTCRALPVASMGPQLYRCGNESKTSHYKRGLWTLQWGRNFIVAEIPIQSSLPVRSRVLQWGRNFIVAEMAPWGR